ncbi:MAG: DUF1290 domain-containing protein [Ruminococcaceae bacterium]|nr:DUF1290 domain-containing protein [Oscillospiraceae bacterium]
MIPIFGLIIGLVVGLAVPYSIPAGYSVYVAVVILTLLDSVLGGTVAVYQGRFDLKIFISGFFGNVAVALALAFIGEQMDVPLYLAAVFAFGNRLFDNFSTVRRLISAEHEKRKALKESQKAEKEN